MDHLDYTFIFPAGESTMDQVAPTFLGFSLDQLPIMFAALAVIMWAVSREYLILPRITFPPFIWQIIYIARGRWWRIKNIMRNYYRFTKHGGSEMRRRLILTFKRNPRSADFNRLFSVQIKSILDAELKAGRCNSKNVQDWLTRFAAIKGLEHMKPYVRKDKKLNAPQIDALKVASKAHLGNGAYKPTKFAAIDKMAPVNLRAVKENKSISTSGKRKFLKLKAA